MRTYRTSGMAILTLLISLLATAHAQTLLSEGFAAYPPTGWTEAKGIIGNPTTLTGTTSGWTADGFGNVGTTGSARLNIWSTTTQDWMFTPQINLGAGGSNSLEFDLAYTPFSGTGSATMGPDDKFAVVISTDGGTTWYQSNTLQLWDSTTPISNTGDHIVISLASYSGVIMLGFYGESTVSNVDNNVYVDNVWIGNPTAPPSCATPVAPTDGATGVAAPNGSLQWVSVGGVTGYYLYLGTDGGGVTPPTNILNGFDVGNVTTYAYTGLAYSTAHYWQVIPYNSYGSASGCAISSFTTMANPNWGSGGTPPNVYYFANSLATGAPSYPTYEWVDITGTGTYVTLTGTNSSTDGADGVLGDDDWVGPIDFDPTIFPSGFTFYGTAYTQFCICSNGKIKLGTLTGINEAIYFGAMGTGATIRPAVYWMGQDMNPQDTDVLDRAVYYGGGGGGMVITFWHYPEYAGTGADDHITAQMIFYPNNTIKIQYNQDQLGGAFNYTSDSHVVGIVNSDGLNYVEYRRLTGSTVNTPGPLFGSNLALMFGPDDTQIPVELASFSGVGGAGFATLRWETATEHENLGYYLLRKAAGVEAFALVNQELVPGAGTTLEPQAYEYRDEGLAAGNYQYKLVDVSFDGVTAEHGPITLAVGEGLPLAYSIQAKSGDPVEFALALPRATQMSLVVYDLAGREVWTVERDEMAAGTYTIAWPGLTGTGSRAASSTYVYRVRCGDEFVQTGKVVLLR